MSGTSTGRHSTESQTTHVQAGSPAQMDKEKAASAHSDAPADTKEAGPSAQQGQGEEPVEHPTGFRLFLICIGLVLTVVTVSLDQTIIAAPLPQITDDFHALSDVGWYGSAYLLCTTALQPMAGRLFTIFSKKWIYIGSLVIFEIGSLICALAHNSKTFIVGRAIAGTGCAALYIGTLLIFSVIAPLEKQAVFTSLIGAGYGIGAVIGPLIGGAIASNTTWRWCFWINLPIGGIAIALTFLFVKTPPPPKQDTLKAVAHLDFLGTALLLGSVISYLLVLQKGGNEWAWGDSRVIGLLVGFVLMMAAFWIVQWFMKDNATIPLRILKSRTIIFGSITNFMTASAYFILLYFLPIYFQSIRGASAIGSGVDILPLICFVIFGTIFAGGAVTKLGYATPFLGAGEILAAIGCGLLFLLTTDTPKANWAGYQILAGMGVGMAFQLPFVASQTVYDDPVDSGLASSAVVFFQILGGCLMVSAAESIFQNLWTQQLNTYPGLPVSTIISRGVTGFRDVLEGEQLDQAVAAAAYAIQRTLVVPIAVSSVAALSAWGIEWKSIKGKQMAAGGA